MVKKKAEGEPVGRKTKYSDNAVVKVLRPDFGREGSLGHTQFQVVKAVAEKHGNNATTARVVEKLKNGGHDAWPALHYFIRSKAIEINETAA